MDDAIRTALSRRRLLTAALAAAAAVPALAGGRLGSILRLASVAGAATAPPLSLARFAPHVGSTFTIGRGPSATVLTLEEATARGPHAADPPGLEGEAFLLVFRAARGPMLRGSIQMLEHPVLGAVPLNLLAFDRPVKGQTYQGVVDLRTAA